MNKRKDKLRKKGKNWWNCKEKFKSNAWKKRRLFKKFKELAILKKIISIVEIYKKVLLVLKT